MGFFSFVKAGGKKFSSEAGKAIKAIKPKQNKTKLDKANSKLAIAIHKNKALKAKLGQTIFEMQNPKFKGKDFTFKGNKGKSESNTEAYKRIQGENTKVLKGMLDKATENKKDGGRMGYKSGSKDRDAGGGADSGRRGEAKSRMGVLINKANRRIKNSKLPESPMKEERIFNTKTERLSKIIGKENVGPGYGREVERPTKKAMGGRIGRKMGGGSDMSNTAVKKKHKGFSKLPESIQIKINKKLAKKV